jgi:CHAD domain-containing protein
MSEVDPYRGWRSMKRLPRALFRALGELRDAHILHSGIAALVSEPLASELSQVVDRRAAEGRERVHRAIDQFDRRAWKRVQRALASRMSLVPADSAAAQCLALERYRALRRAHSRVLRQPNPENWHAVRIAVKQFRYLVETMLPRRHALWQADLQDIQELLGQLHDLHTLDAFVAAEASAAHPEIAAAARTRIGQQCAVYVDEYRRRTRGRGSVPGRWRAGLPASARIEAANAARLRATVRAADPNPRRTLRTARLALEIFDVVAASLHQVGPGIQQGSASVQEPATSYQEPAIIAKRLLRAAARLHGVRGDDKRVSRQKSAFRIVRRLSRPVGWTRADWSAVAWIVRYYRGPEPKATHRAFSRLPAERQHLVRGLAGALRLARALRRSGARSVGPGRPSADGDIRIRAMGVADGRKPAARIAAAKHLLETYLQRHIIVERSHV